QAEQVAPGQIARWNGVLNGRSRIIMQQSLSTLGLWGIPLAVLGGALRVSAPFLFVSLGECITEKAGRINLGLEGTLVMGAMSGYGVSLWTGSPWLGVLGASLVGAAF